MQTMTVKNIATFLYHIPRCNKGNKQVYMKEKRYVMKEKGRTRARNIIERE